MPSKTLARPAAAVRILAVAVIAVLLVAGCGSGGGPAGGSAGGSGSGSTASRVAEHNAADTAFAQRMIPHHQEAVTMATTVIDKGRDPQVKDLARKIKAAQQPEIEEMTRWLKAWGESATPPTHGAIPGMMSDVEMKRFDAASGAALDRMFLEMMIRHHEGAVTMADNELRAGENAAAKELAQRIKQTQTAEIATMKQLLARR